MAWVLLGVTIAATCYSFYIADRIMMEESMPKVEVWTVGQAEPRLLGEPRRFRCDCCKHEWDCVNPVSEEFQEVEHSLTGCPGRVVEILQ